MILTFYSYKGGVGRSMALANLGEWFRQQGLRVVMVDWDLEAPGLESFFAAGAAEREAVRGRLGLLDLIVSYQDLYASLPRGAAAQNEAAADALRRKVSMLIDALPPVAHLLVALPPAPTAPPSSGKLWLLTAGCRSEKRFDAYAHLVQQFDWEDFYARYDGATYFEWLRRQLLDPALADVVLIDSRTGVAEMSGVCTRQLADVVVMFSAPNDQNLEGVAMMARSFTRPDLIAARGGRPIELVAVPARLDVSEGRPIDLFEERFRAQLEPYLPETFRRLGTSFGRLRIPYISAYAYAERLAIGDPEGVKSLQEAYVLLATHLAALSPAASALRRACRQALQKTFGLPTVFVASLDPGDAAFADELQRRLDGTGVIAVLEPGLADAALDAAINARAGAEGSASVLIAAGAAALADPRLALVVRRAREHAICLFPVAAQATDAASQPRWARRTRIHDAQAGWDMLVPLLQSPCRAQRVPFMVPPRPVHFVGRVPEITRIKALLLAAEPADARPVALVGLGGAGKSAIARAVCNDDEVLDRFDDGILWINAGVAADLAKELAAAVAAFGEDTQSIANAEQAGRRLAELLGTRNCLVVVDDVTGSSQLRSVPRAAPGVRLLFTSRARDLAAEVGAAVVEVGPPPEADAAAVLTAGLGGVSFDPAMVARVVDALSGLPLAMELVNQGLRKRIELGDRPELALHEVVDRIADEGLTAVDPGLVADPGRSVFASFMLAAERLEPEDRARLPLLAGLPADRPIRVMDVAAACSIDEAAAVRLMRRLAAVSLFDLERSGTARVPPVVHAFLRSIERRQRRAETTRMAAQAPAAAPAASARPAAEGGRRSAGGAARIWLCYRRDDADAYAARLYDRLAREFGYDRVFMDVTGIEPGTDFVRTVETTIAAVAVMVVVIGPNWLGEANAGGLRRIDDPSDFVRLEIATALARDIRVIPVLVRGARMPAATELPDALAPLARRNALEISDSRFEHDVDELVAAIGLAAAGKRVAPELAAPARRLRLTATLVAAVVLAGAALVWWSSLGTSVSPPPTPASPEAQKLYDQAEDRYFGRNGPQDHVASVELYRRAAELGFAPAKNSLGRAYENGQGVAKDLPQAIFWYQEAAKAGHPDAIAALTRLGAGGAPKK